MSALSAIAGRMRSTWFNHRVPLFERKAQLIVPAMPSAPAHPSYLLAHALREASNLELDWLWYADQMPAAVEREYCLARARWINP